MSSAARTVTARNGADATGLIEAVSLSKRLVPARRGEREDRADFRLREVTFSIAPGESVALLGGNGAGKTTLLRLLAGIYAPSSGTLRVRGRRSHLMSLGATFSPALTVREHLRTLAVARGCALDLDAALSLGRLASVASTPVRVLSMGERARVTIATGLTLPADVYLIDEALAVCDPQFRAEAIEVLRSRLGDGAAVVLAGQDLAIPQLFCTRGLVLAAGRLVLDADVERAVWAFASGSAGSTMDPASRAPEPVTIAVTTDAAWAGAEPLGIACTIRNAPARARLRLGLKAPGGEVVFTSTVVRAGGGGADGGAPWEVRMAVPGEQLPHGEYVLAAAVTDGDGITLCSADPVARVVVAAVPGRNLQAHDVAGE